ncbi:MAG: hypothetical protein QM723_26755 [Myxococcaceae bacterium]
MLDEKAVRPAGFEEHLASCSKCRALVEAHQAALALRGAVVPRARRVSKRAVVGRLGVAVALLIGVVVAWVKKPEALTSPGERIALVRPLPPGEGVLTAAPEVDFGALRFSDEGWAALGELHTFTQNTTRRNPSVELAYADRSLATSYLLTSTLEE